MALEPVRKDSRQAPNVTDAITRLKMFTYGRAEDFLIRPASISVFYIANNKEALSDFNTTWPALWRGYVVDDQGAFVFFEDDHLTEGGKPVKHLMQILQRSCMHLIDADGVLNRVHMAVQPPESAIPLLKTWISRQLGDANGRP